MSNPKKTAPAVLVVEDDEPLLRFVTQALRMAGYEVTTAHSAAEARTHLGEHAFDLAIVDIGLPDADGVEFGHSLMAEYALPYIHLTGQTEAEAYQRAARGGALTYLIKPVGMEQLIAAVETAVSRSSEMGKLLKSVERLSSDFEDRKSISIAVGIVMERFGLSDSEAFEVLRYLARSHQERLEATAERLIAGGGGLDLLISLNRYLSKIDGASRKPRG
ncbi:MAG: response regulator [Gammaproteobacteria bacterium]|nr:response regulator [Gammaproteobacteria bacterium]MCP5199017.1 response regulator [Gammaproteobacteria bacterium]